MSLLSSSESIAFNGFLASLDYSDVLSEWPAIANNLALPKGKEILARATRDLISLDSPSASPSDIHTTNTIRPPSPSPSPPSPSSSSSSSPSSSPSSPTEDPPPNMQMHSLTATAAASSPSAINVWPPYVQSNDPNNHNHHRYTYGFNIPTHLRQGPSQSPLSSRSHLPYFPYDTNGIPNALPNHHPPPQLPLPYPHAHSESSLRHRPPILSSPLSPSQSHSHSFLLPPLPDHAQLHSAVTAQNLYSSHHNSFPSTIDSLQRPNPLNAVPASSVLLHHPSSTKRALPADNDSDASSSREAAKRQRRPSSSSSSLDTANPGFSRDISEAPTAPNTTGASSSATTAAGGTSQRQALLSPSQKRANHIQSEQKRRANIRRGYEALCEVVPALREAIKAEEEGLAAAAEEDVKSSNSKSRASSRKKSKGKGKANSGDDGCGTNPAGVLDGRAGPRSENVVLQQTIDYLNSLLTDRQALAQRLAYARSTLSSQHPTHPALQVSPEHLVPPTSSTSSSSSPSSSSSDPLSSSSSSTGATAMSSTDGSGNGSDGGLMMIPMWEREWTGGTGYGVDMDESED